MRYPDEDIQEQYRLKRIHQRPYWVMLILLLLILYSLYLTRNVAIDVSKLCRATTTEEQAHYCAEYWSDHYG